MIRSFQGVSVMTRLPAARLRAGLPQALRPFAFLIAITGGWFTAVTAVLCLAGLSFLQRLSLLRQLLGQFCQLTGQVMEQAANRSLTFFKGKMDFFICGDSKVHEAEHKPNGHRFATIPVAE
jgi:hypothetical protein